MTSPQSWAAAGWYALRNGPIAFVFLNSELSVAPGSPQHAWADGYLRALNGNAAPGNGQPSRLSTPWVFVVWHRPMYLVDHVVAPMQAIEPLLLQHAVDGVINGHMHHAIVTGTVFNGSVVTAATSPGARPDGYVAPIHFILGHAGQTLYDVPPPGPGSGREPYVAFAQAQFGFAEMTAANETALTVRLLGSSDGSERYAVTMARTYPRITA